LASHSTNKVRRKRRPLFSETYTSQEYRPYVMAIGQIALAWNDLHESIGALFNSTASIIGEDKVEAAFQAVDSDRLKRRMLKAVFSQLDPKERKLNPKAIEDVKWLCGQIDALEESRNNAIHSPLHNFQLSGLIPDYPDGVQPNTTRGNTRAKKLKDKHLLTEYRYVRDAAIVLRDFVEAIEESWNWTANKLHTWPERPQLPNRGQKNRRPALPSDQAKQLLLLPEPSQG
jgi:hypothetical protein